MNAPTSISQMELSKTSARYHPLNQSFRHSIQPPIKSSSEPWSASTLFLSSTILSSIRSIISKSANNEDGDDKDEDDDDDEDEDEDEDEEEEENDEDEDAGCSPCSESTSRI